MANMLAFHCKEWKTDEDYWEMCNYHVLFKEGDDPTTSTGCCPGCGSPNWEMWETNLSEVEYFKRLLKDPHAKLGYQIVTQIS